MVERHEPLRPGLGEARARDAQRVLRPERRAQDETARLVHERRRPEDERPARARELAPEVVAALEEHSWPGNVRELGNIVERLLLFSPGPRIELRDLPDPLGGVRASDDLYREFATLEAGIAAFRRYHASRALARENGDEAAAARRLGVEVTVLRQALSGSAGR